MGAELRGRRDEEIPGGSPSGFVNQETILPE
jgi:hypothetical protein